MHYLANYIHLCVTGLLGHPNIIEYVTITQFV